MYVLNHYLLNRNWHYIIQSLNNFVVIVCHIYLNNFYCRPCYHLLDQSHEPELHFAFVVFYHCYLPVLLFMIWFSALPYDLSHSTVLWYFTPIPHPPTHTRPPLPTTTTTRGMSVHHAYFQRQCSKFYSFCFYLITVYII